MTNRLQIALNPSLGWSYQKRLLESIIAATDDTDELNQATQALERIEAVLNRKEVKAESAQIDKDAREQAKHRREL